MSSYTMAPPHTCWCSYGRSQGRLAKAPWHPNVTRALSQLQDPELSHPHPRAFLSFSVLAVPVVLGTQRNFWGHQAGEPEKKHLQNLLGLGAPGRGQIRCVELSSVTVTSGKILAQPGQRESTHKCNLCVTVRHGRPVLGPPFTEEGRAMNRV